jgi:hypothetical protein
MFRSILSACAVAVALSVAVATTAWAQDPGRIRGEIMKADGGMLVLKTREGATLNVKIDDKTRVNALVKASLADIKTDSFIGIGGVPQPDGSIQAFSVHIFTAFGAAIALLAMLEAVREHWAAMFQWLGVALIIDVADDDTDLVDVACQHDRRPAFTVYLGEAVAGDVAADLGKLFCLLAPDLGRRGLKPRRAWGVEELLQEIERL